jgi:acyl-CoA reductase-like NAD-dependent aldehyde dehydrogenase
MEPVAGMHGILVSSEMGGKAGAEVFELAQDINRTADRIVSFASKSPAWRSGSW